VTGEAWLILASILTPLTLVALGAFRTFRRWLPALCLAAPAPALAVALAWPETTVNLPWIMLDSRLTLDALGRTFLTLFAVLYAVAAWHSFFYLRRKERRQSYAVVFLLAMAGNFGVALAGDVVTFYAFFALMSFSAYGLVAHDREPASMRAARVYLVLVVVGELALFGGAVLSAAETGTDFGASFQPPPLGLALVGLAFAVKAGLVPTHFWLPLAHPAAPAPASAVLSGAMIKVGLLGALRFMPPEGLGAASDLLVLLGCATAIYGVAVGVLQTNPKTVLAYSSISQMGLIAVGVALATDASASDAAVAATLVFALHHGFAKAALFLGAAARPKAFTGWRWKLRIVGLVLPAIALAGAPFTSGAIAKGALKALDVGPGWIDLFLSLSSLGTTLLMVRFVSLMLKQDGAEAPGTHLPWATAVAASTSFVWLWPPAAAWLGHSISGKALLASLWPVLIGAAVALIIGRLIHPSGKPLIPPGDVLVLLERLKPSWAGRSAQRASPGEAWARRSDKSVEIADRAERATQTWSFGALLLVLLGATLFAAAVVAPW